MFLENLIFFVNSKIVFETVDGGVGISESREKIKMRAVCVFSYPSAKVFDDEPC